MSCVDTTQSVSAVFCPLYHHLPSVNVKHHCDIRVAYRKNKHIWQ